MTCVQQSPGNMLIFHNKIPRRERMKKELIKSIAITDSSLGEEEIEEKLEQGDLTAFPTSILQVCCKNSIGYFGQWNKGTFISGFSRFERCGQR